MGLARIGDITRLVVRLAVRAGSPSRTSTVLGAAGARPRPVVQTNSISTLYAHVGAGVVWPEHRAEPLLTRALITTVPELDLVAVVDRSAASGR
jgi:hypothetical protein